jgi:hypothetical protein
VTKKKKEEKEGRRKRRKEEGRKIKEGPKKGERKCSSVMSIMFDLH